MLYGSFPGNLGDVQIFTEKGSKVGYNSVTFEDVDKPDAEINQAVGVDGELCKQLLPATCLNNRFSQTYHRKKI